MPLDWNKCRAEIDGFRRLKDNFDLYGAKAFKEADIAWLHSVLDEIAKLEWPILPDVRAIDGGAFFEWIRDGRNGYIETTDTGTCWSVLDYSGEREIVGGSDEIEHNLESTALAIAMIHGTMFEDLVLTGKAKD